MVRFQKDKKVRTRTAVSNKTNSSRKNGPNTPREPALGPPATSKSSIKAAKTSRGKPSPGKGNSGAQHDHAVLKGQVLALGGDQSDFDLVKYVGDGLDTSTDEVEDPALAKDVSTFLKALKLGKDPAPKSKDDTLRHTKPAVPTVPVPSAIPSGTKARMTLGPQAQWYASTPPLSPSPSVVAPTPAQLATLTSRAATLHAAEIAAFQSPSSSTHSPSTSASEAAFLSKIITSGTLSDRLSALTLLVQGSPLHNTRALETLRGMAERGKGKGGRDESLKALRCVVDWWVGGGVPGRKLKYFRDQPLLHPGVTNGHLVIWFFEDWLKKYFFSILQILEALSLDPLPYVRTQALSLIFTLLRDKPEQEQNLLRLLVNKLGDTQKPLCARASHYLLQILQVHPSMKAVIVQEIGSLVLRPAASTSSSVVPATTPTPAPPNKNIRFSDTTSAKKILPEKQKKPAEKTAKPTNLHVWYYAAITFNQIVLTPAEGPVAQRLMELYFEMFRGVLGEGSGRDSGEGEEDDTKTPDKLKDNKKGKNRRGKDDRELQTDKHGRVRDNGKTKRKGDKGKKVTGDAGFAEVEDASSKLISAILTGVNRALPFVGWGASGSTLSKHMDTLFRITHTSTFNISLQALVLIQQVVASLPSTSRSTPASTSTSTSTSKVVPMAQSITDRFYRTLYASLHDPRLARSSKQAMYLNLLFRSIKASAEAGSAGDRAKALVRRFIQVLVSGGGSATEFVVGGLYLLGELFSSIPGLREMLTETSRNTNVEEETYDPRKRDPQFAHAGASPFWELTPLLHHYHPAIALHARQLLACEPLTASADLSSNTLSQFLDRFVYKNPKKLKASADGAVGLGKGGSAMQPVAGGADGGVRLVRGEAGKVLSGDGEGRVNEKAFLRRGMKDVPVDQLFFHKFFTRKNEQEKAKTAKAEKRKGNDANNNDGDGVNEGDTESINLDSGDEEDSDDEETEIWKAMKASMPKAAGDDLLVEDSDVENVPSDFDDEDEDEDDDEGSAVDADADNSDGLSLAEGSDNEDLVSLEDDLPGGLIEYDGSDSDDEDEWNGVGEDTNSRGGIKRKHGDEGTRSGRRKKLRSLPTFASYEDYAKMIEDGPEDDI